MWAVIFQLCVATAVKVIEKYNTHANIPSLCITLLTLLGWLLRSSIPVSSLSESSIRLMNSTDGSLWEQKRSMARDATWQACRTRSWGPSGGGSLHAATTDSRSWHTESTNTDPASTSGLNHRASRPLLFPSTRCRAHSDWRKCTWGCSTLSWGPPWWQEGTGSWGTETAGWGSSRKSSGVSESQPGWGSDGPNRSRELSSTALSWPGGIHTHTVEKSQSTALQPHTWPKCMRIYCHTVLDIQYITRLSPSRSLNKNIFISTISFKSKSNLRSGGHWDHIMGTPVCRWQTDKIHSILVEEIQLDYHMN